MALSQKACSGICVMFLLLLCAKMLTLFNSWENNGRGHLRLHLSSVLLITSDLWCDKLLMLVGKCLYVILNNRSIDLGPGIVKILCTYQTNATIEALKYFKTAPFLFNQNPPQPSIPTSTGQWGRGHFRNSRDSRFQNIPLIGDMNGFYDHYDHDCLDCYDVSWGSSWWW